MPFNQSEANAQAIIGTYSDVSGNQINNNSKIALLTFDPSNVYTYCHITGVSNYTTSKGEESQATLRIVIQLILMNIFLFNQAYNLTINNGRVIVNGMGDPPESTLNQNATITYE